MEGEGRGGGCSVLTVRLGWVSVHASRPLMVNTIGPFTPVIQGSGINRLESASI